MRRIIYNICALCVFAGVTLSCARSEVDLDDRVMRFSPATAKVTKTIIDGTTFPTDSTFVVSAIHTNGTYFDNLVASYDSSVSLWATSDPQYWPLSGALAFYAYAPSAIATYSGTTLSIDDSDGVYAADYTCDGVTDFLYASYLVDDCENHPESVPMTFSHALSQIVVNVKQKADYTAEISNKTNVVTITVDSVSVRGAYVKADFVQLPDAEWLITQNSETGELQLGGNQALHYGDDPVQLGRILTIPQSLTSVTIHTVYTVTQTITDNTTSETNVLSVKTPADVELSTFLSAWECGKKYVYTISYGLDPIEVTATTVDWTAVSGVIIVEEE